mgnify:CR=1 FL=1
MPADYDFLDVNCKGVVDIGASIGDTLVYFTLRGAKVIAFEPFPKMFKLRKRMLKRTNYKIKSSWLMPVAVMTGRQE